MSYSSESRQATPPPSNQHETPGSTRDRSGFVLRPPHKPEPTDPRAQVFLEWTDVIVYAVWRASSVIALAVALILAVLLYGPSILK